MSPEFTVLVWVLVTGTLILLLAIASIATGVIGT